MDREVDLLQQIEALRERLSRLSEAGLRINESLDFDTVLQEVLDSARALTRARYGVITLLDESGRVRDFLSSGMTPEEAEGVWGHGSAGLEIFNHLNSFQEPLRLPDLLGHIRSMGLPNLSPPMPVGSAIPFLAAPVFHRGERFGNLFLAERERGEEFTLEDEETLQMFASQAAMVIANARRYRDEQRARNDLETLINTSPVGVAVFDVRTGAPLSFNREAMRMMDTLRNPDQPPEHLLEVMTVRRADGREISLEELPMSQALSAGETVRAEEVALQVPDGRSVTVLINATPIRSEDGEIETLVVTMQDMTPLQEIERLRAEFLAMVSHELRTPPGHGQGLGVRPAGRVLRNAPRRGAPVPSDHLRTDRPDARADRRPPGCGSLSDWRSVHHPGPDGCRSSDGRGRELLPYRRAWAQPSHRHPAGPALGDGGQFAHRPGA